MLNLGLNRWLSHLTESSHQRLEDQLMSLVQPQKNQEIESVESLLLAYFKLLARTENMSRENADGLIHGFFGKHNPQKAYCESDLSILGVQNADISQVDDFSEVNDWQALGYAYTLEVIAARFFKVFSDLSSSLNVDLSQKLYYFSTQNFIFTDRWIDFMACLSSLEQEGVDRFQFDDMLEGVLAGMDVWEACLSATPQSEAS